MIHVNRQRVALLLVMIVGIGLVALPSRDWATAKLIYNPSSSAPLGWYLVKATTDIHRGEFAVVRLPAPIAALADERKYLPKAVPLLKSVAAVAGDLVCEQQGVVQINDAVVARSLQRDGAGRELVEWTGCRQLHAGDLFVLGTTNDASFDSRYYGPLSASSVIGKAIPLWTW
jgi:conjugative transfer signal peptidase TraF